MLEKFIETVIKDSPLALVAIGLFLLLIGALGGLPPSLLIQELGWRIVLAVIGAVVASNGILMLWRPPTTPPPGNSTIRILTRDQANTLAGSVQERLKKARREVRISGNDCKFVAESASPWIEEALRRGVFIKILCVDPRSHAPGMLAKIDPRFPTPSAFVDSMVTVEKELRRIKKEFPRNFEFRYLPILPAMGFFIIDPSSSSGSLKVEIYVSKPFQCIESRPHLIIPQDMKDWHEYFLGQWDNYWAMSKEAE